MTDVSTNDHLLDSETDMELTIPGEAKEGSTSGADQPGVTGTSDKQVKDSTFGSRDIRTNVERKVYNTVSESTTEEPDRKETAQETKEQPKTKTIIKLQMFHKKATSYKIGQANLGTKCKLCEFKGVGKNLKEHIKLHYMRLYCSCGVSLDSTDDLSIHLEKAGEKCTPGQGFFVDPFTFSQFQEQFNLQHILFRDLPTLRKPLGRDTDARAILNMKRTSECSHAPSSTETRFVSCMDPTHATFGQVMQERDRLRTENVRLEREVRTLANLRDQLRGHISAANALVNMQFGGY